MRTVAGFYTAEYAGKNPPDFGREVKRWLHKGFICGVKKNQGLVVSA